ncbi:hypothetical protein BP6252_01084 [Coleophoma cylindrospora]|uniref:Uncharacterized protein n=1 Tax=Coleophoma cylindrospora TaxID=1849047 RepID=A0A3D8SRX5_9HELO|nr:hypothetical protein BP6252_01084 [Coleophoma cylindrospora]
MTSTPCVGPREEWYGTPSPMKHAPHPLQEQFERMEERLALLASLDSKHREQLRTLDLDMSTLRESSVGLARDVAGYATRISTPSSPHSPTKPATITYPELLPATPPSAPPSTQPSSMKTITSPDVLPFTLQPPPPKEVFRSLVQELPSTPTKKGRSTTSSIAAGFWKGFWTPEKADQSSPSSSPDLLTPGKTHFRVAGQETVSPPVPQAFMFRSSHFSAPSSPPPPQKSLRIQTDLLEKDTTVPLKITFSPQRPDFPMRLIDVTLQAPTEIKTAPMRLMSVPRPKSHREPGHPPPEAAFTVDIQPDQVKNLTRLPIRASQHRRDVSEVKSRSPTNPELWEPFPDFRREKFPSELDDVAWQNSVVGKAEMDMRAGSLSPLQIPKRAESGDVDLRNLLDARTIWA